MESVPVFSGDCDPQPPDPRQGLLHSTGSKATTGLIRQKHSNKNMFRSKQNEEPSISEDGSMLSTSVPCFDIYIDFVAEGLREKDGKAFKENSILSPLR